MYKQVIEVINMGIVIIDRQYTITEWNRWMEIHSRIEKKDILGAFIFKRYPHLSSPSFLRSCKSVLSFGNYVYYSQKLHNYMFPMKPAGFHAGDFDFMQQSCTMTPVREENCKVTHIVITVQDVTENVYMEGTLRMMTQNDGLTGIYNRRYLDNRLQEEFNRFRRKGSIFSLLMMDIDNFKKVNDTYGHQFGDQVLKELAALSRSIIRGSDILARYGGEEFCIILPETDIAGAYAFAERIRKGINEKNIPDKNCRSVSVSISIGLTEIDSSMKDYGQLIDQADMAMYESKKNGKNCVSVFSKNC